MAQPLTSGIHHLGLTVQELEAARDFFVEALHFQLVAEKPDYPAAFVSDGKILITLWQAIESEPTSFDRKRNLGLHHFALQIQPEADLEQIQQALAQRNDVEVEFTPEPLGPGPTTHCMLLIPGGLRMELIAPAQS